MTHRWPLKVVNQVIYDVTVMISLDFSDDSHSQQHRGLGQVRLRRPPSFQLRDDRFSSFALLRPQTYFRLKRVMLQILQTRLTNN